MPIGLIVNILLAAGMAIGPIMKLVKGASMKVGPAAKAMKAAQKALASGGELSKADMALLRKGANATKNLKLNMGDLMNLGFAGFIGSQILGEQGTEAEMEAQQILQQASGGVDRLRLERALQQQQNIGGALSFENKFRGAMADFGPQAQEEIARDQAIQAAMLQHQGILEEVLQLPQPPVSPAMKFQQLLAQGPMGQ